MMVRMLVSIEWICWGMAFLGVRSWDSQFAVPVALDRIPQTATEGSVWIVRVNTDAERHEDLRFEEWEPAPEPLPEGVIGDLSYRIKIK